MNKKTQKMSENHHAAVFQIGRCFYPEQSHLHKKVFISTGGIFFFYYSLATYRTVLAAGFRSWNSVINAPAHGCVA